MTNPVRIAVAGAGLIGQAHIKRVLEEPEAALAAIIDPTLKTKAQAEALNVRWAASFDELLQGAKPDALVIATPNQTHAAISLQAVRAGVPMLIEKPITDDVHTALAFTEAAEAARVPVLVGHHRRHSPLIQCAKEVVASGQLGRITAINGLCCFLKPATGYFDGANSWRSAPGAGVVLLNLIHVIDDLRNICGDIIAVQAAESNAARGFPVEDTAAIILHFTNGALGTLLISDSAAAPWSWELTAGENKAYPQTEQFCYFVAGMRGSVTVPRGDIWRYDEHGNWMTPIHLSRSVVPEQDPLTLQMRHFCAVARREVAPVIDAREGTKTLETTLAVKRAAVEGGIVRVATCQ